MLNDLRVGASVSHGEKSRLVVLQLEVLVGELLAVDGLATSALYTLSVLMHGSWSCRIVRCHG